MAKDERIGKLADLVLDYSVDIKPDDKLLIQFDPTYTKYANSIGEKAREKSVNVRYDSTSYNPTVLRGLIRRNDMDEWGEELERRNKNSVWCNSRILLNCFSSPDYAKGIQDSQTRVADFNKKVVGPYKEILYRPTPSGGCYVKWNIVGFPCDNGAKDAGMPLEEYTDFVYSATIGNDWNKMGKQMKKIKSAFDEAKDVHILVPGLTDLHLSIDGRGGKIGEGKRNMPDGEVFYGPVEDSANGKIYFQVPTRRDGLGVIRGINLEFKDGVVTNYSANENQKALEEVLKVDEGVRRVGELGIGCNYGIKKAVLETLFDEKIGGTIHLALGDSFTEHPLSSGGGLNKSNVHWDIVCDLRQNLGNLSQYPGGEIRIDGKLVQKDGIWKI